MNYSQPVYTLVTQKDSAFALTTTLGLYQSALAHALDLEAISDGAYRENLHEALDAMYMHEKTVAKNAMQHAVVILDMLDIINATEYRRYRNLITQWFGNTVFIKGSEFVFHNGQWYSRRWENVKISKPKHKVAVFYARDFNIGQAETAGLSLAFIGGKTQMLVHGGKMEKRTKLTLNEQQKFIRNLKGDARDAQNSEKIRAHTAVVDNRLKTVRTGHINDAAAEILGYSRTVVFCGPTTFNDAQHYRKIGVPELFEFMLLIEVMVRRQTDNVFISEYDTRLMQPIYNDSRDGHAEVASQILRQTNGLMSLREE